MVEMQQTVNGWQAHCRCGWRSDFGSESEMELARAEHREYVHGIVEDTPHFPDAQVTMVGAADLVDARTAAQMLSITNNNLRQWVFRKKIAVAKREGRRAYFLRDDIARLNTSRTATPSSV